MCYAATINGKIIFFAFTAHTTWAQRSNSLQKGKSLRFIGKIDIHCTAKCCSCCNFQQRFWKSSHSMYFTAPLDALYEDSMTHDQSPYHVSLQATDVQNKHFCGAAIISPVLLVLVPLTAFDHHRLPFPYIQAVAGVRNLKTLDVTAQVRNVTQVYVYEKYKMPERGTTTLPSCYSTAHLTSRIKTYVQ